MNVICNDCVGARFMERCGFQFSNPFTWAAIDFESFYNLILNYNSMDFKNTVFSYIMHKGEKVVQCLIDNRVIVRYIHFIQKDGMTETKKRMKTLNDISVLSGNAIEYTQERYNRRLSRMTEDPIFILSFFYTQGLNEEQIKERISKILTIKDQKIIILLHKRYANVFNWDELQENQRIILYDKTMKEIDGLSFVDGIKEKILKKIVEMGL